MHYLQTKPLSWVPEANGASRVSLQGLRLDDFVTVCVFAPHMNLIVSPTEALTANGTKRKTPCDGATMTVWTAPVPVGPVLLGEFIVGVGT